MWNIKTLFLYNLIIKTSLDYTIILQINHIFNSISKWLNIKQFSKKSTKKIVLIKYIKSYFNSKINQMTYSNSDP